MSTSTGTTLIATRPEWAPTSAMKVVKMRFFQLMLFGSISWFSKIEENCDQQRGCGF